MASYIPSTREERAEMLAVVGVNSYEELYRDVPAEMLLHDGDLNIPEGLSELEVCRKVTKMAQKNVIFPTVLRGAGAYDHYIPSIVAYVIGSRSAQKCMLKALLEPRELISRHELAGDTFEVLQLIEEGKTMPWNAVYDEFCVRNGVPVGNDVIAVIKEYEKTVLSYR